MSLSERGSGSRGISWSPASPRDPTLRCAGCLVLLGLVAVVGGHGDGADASAAAPAYRQLAVHSAGLHRKRVFDERRARFEAARQGETRTAQR